jgi:DNA mismatch endonuclease (patch repair protein)
MIVRRTLHAMGLRFRLFRRDLPGRPDIVLPKHRLVIFVHGCFWHRHGGCGLSSTPKTRVEFWTEKFATNIARDARNTAELRDLGFRVGVIWECETLQPDITERLAGFLENSI